jgi:hypothetical protein
MLLFLILCEVSSKKFEYCHSNFQNPTMIVATASPHLRSLPASLSFSTEG